MNALKKYTRLAARVSVVSLLVVYLFMKVAAFMERGDWGVSGAELMMVFLAVVVPMMIIEAGKDKLRSKRGDSND